jgi:integrase
MPRPDPTNNPPRNPYEKLAAELRHAILAGDLTPGAVLPTYAELAKQHRVPVGTVNRAIALLSDAGLVVSTRGKRTVVAAPG